jgi:hypothetical protein
MLNDFTQVLATLFTLLKVRSWLSVRGLREKPSKRDADEHRKVQHEKRGANQACSPCIQLTISIKQASSESDGDVTVLQHH